LRRKEIQEDTLAANFRVTALPIPELAPVTRAHISPFAVFPYLFFKSFSLHNTICSKWGTVNKSNYSLLCLAENVFSIRFIDI
jgi:hypothetical protein